MKYFSTLFLGLSLLFTSCAPTEEAQEPVEMGPGVYSAYSAELQNQAGTEMSATADMSFDPEAEQPFAVLVIFQNYTQAPAGEAYQAVLLKGNAEKDLGDMVITTFANGSVGTFLYNAEEDFTTYTDLEIRLKDEVLLKGTFSSK